jgi:hypothetical protein
MSNTRRTQNPDPGSVVRRALARRARFRPEPPSLQHLEAVATEADAQGPDEATAQRLDALDARLWAVARRTDDPQGSVRAARDFADDVFVGLVFAAGSGVHTVNCSVPTEVGTLSAGRDLRMSILSEVAALSYPRDGADVEVRELFALAHASGAPATAIMRTRDLDPAVGGYTVRGWRVSASGTEPLDAAGMFAFCCSEATSGEPLPIDPNTRYADAVPLTRSGDDAGRNRRATESEPGSWRGP